MLTNLARNLNYGLLGGFGKLAFLPMDQCFGHGPRRSLAPERPAYDRCYFPQLAIEAGLNAYTAPLGSLEAGIADYFSEIPTILKLNIQDLLYMENAPLGARTCSVSEVLRLLC